MYGTLIDRSLRAIEAAKTIGYSVKDKSTGKVYRYGDNAYMDMCIENCIFVDRNADIVENPNNYHGFDRGKWELIIS